MGVDLVGGEALDDLNEGGLEARGIGRDGDVEAAAGAAMVGVGDGVARGVMVVAEVLSAKGGRAAAVVVGEDVGAGVGWLGVGHGYTPPPGIFLAESFDSKRLRPGLVEV